MPLKILHISTRLILGGSQENTVLSSEGQARRGHEVHLAFGPIYGPEGSLLDRVERFRTSDGRRIETHVVPHLVREVHPLRDREAIVELRSLIATLRPDIVHTHSSKAGILGRIAAWNPNLPASMRRVLDFARNLPDRSVPAADRAGIVHTIHGPPFMPIEGWPHRRLKTAAMNLAYVHAERAAARACDVIVSVADAMTREFLRRGIGKPEQYITVRSGMETGPLLHAAAGEDQVSVRGRLGLPDHAFVVGTVARLAQHKGHDDLLDALGEDLRANPQWKLLWVGDGWWRERLLARARGLGLSVAELDKEGARSTAADCSIVLTGLVPPERIPGLIRAMDVLAHPSYREGLPRTVPQALLCGVMPIAYDADGTSEICREMETGRLVPVGDRAALREAVRWAAANPENRGELAAKGREECRVAFAAETMVEELERVYEGAIGHARGAKRS